MYEYMYRMPGMVYAAGPLRADSLVDAKRKLREILEVKRLPKGTEVWRYKRWY